MCGRFKSNLVREQILAISVTAPDLFIRYDWKQQIDGAARLSPPRTFLEPNVMYYGVNCWLLGFISKLYNRCLVSWIYCVRVLPETQFPIRPCYSLILNEAIWQWVTPKSSSLVILLCECFTTYYLCKFT